jgi:hypothetical protein
MEREDEERELDIGQRGEQFLQADGRGGRERCKDGYQINSRVDDALHSNQGLR